MTVRVLLFASYADAIGTTEMALEVPAGARVGDVVARVRELSPTRALPPAPLVAVNATYAPSTQLLASGDEVAIIPPVAGG
jgi:molybdopterin converting factor subunit 1